MSERVPPWAQRSIRLALWPLFPTAAGAPRGPYSRSELWRRLADHPPSSGGVDSFRRETGSSRSSFFSRVRVTCSERASTCPWSWLASAWRCWALPCSKNFWMT
eukprot:1320455-Pyramimonas_sp.AAC.1